MLELFKTRLGTAICARRIPTCAHFHVYGQIRLCCTASKIAKGNIHCSQRGQPSHAAVEGEGRIVFLHHQLCITKANWCGIGKFIQYHNKTMFLKQRNIVFECNIFTIWNTACDASFLKHYHTPVIHFDILHFKNEETLYYSAGPISRYSRIAL